MGLADLFKLLGLPDPEEQKRQLFLKKLIEEQEKKISRDHQGNIRQQGDGGVFSDSLPFTLQDRLRLLDKENWMRMQLNQFPPARPMLIPNVNPLEDGRTRQDLYKGLYL